MKEFPDAKPNLKDKVPDHVLSVKVLSDFKRNQNFNTPSISEGIPQALESFNLLQQDPGENCGGLRYQCQRELAERLHRGSDPT
jgi:hypothetical protein